LQNGSHYIQGRKGTFFPLVSQVHHQREEGTFGSMSILQRILDEASDRNLTNGGRLLAIFDLDSTLFDLTLRMVRIVEAFGDDPVWKERYPKECEALKTLPIKPSDWGLKEALERVGLLERDHAEFYRDLHQFWAACFFSGDFVHHDEPLPGAVAFVREIKKRGADIMYLTGRDVPRMLTATAETLRAAGFPVDEPGVELILKPQAEMDDARFKVDVMRDLNSRYSKIWLFENEPVNLNLTAQELPHIGLVFIDSCHSGREQVSETLDRIRHFEVTTQEFEDEFARGK
jgi:HAD superfamily, subfamily IIIB (Acid phosphatase)